MQGGFEKNIQQQMQDFNLEPSPLVWQEIDAALDGKKRRRFAAWWWLLPGVAALLISFFGMIYFSTKEETTQKADNQQAAANIATKKDQRENNQHQPTDEKKNQSATIATDKLTDKKDEQTINSDITTKQTTTTSYKNNFGQKSNEVVKNGHESKFVERSTTAHPVDVIVSSADTPKKNLGEESSPLQTEIATIDNSYLENSKKTTNLNVRAADIKMKTPSRKKQQWSFVAGGGPMSVKESSLGIFSSGQNMLDNNYNSPGSPGNGSNSGGFPPPRPDSASYITVANSGYHLLAGIQYTRELARGVEIAGGLQYRFLSNRQKAGSYMYSSQYYSLTGGALLYNAGTTTTVTNTAHWLEIPAFMIFTVNPASKTKFSIQAGGSYAWMFASNWILPDTKLNKLYYNDSLLNKHIFNVNIGTAVKLPSDISFGLRYQRSITKLTDQASMPKLIWQNWSFYSTLPLQLKKRH